MSSDLASQALDKTQEAQFTAETSPKSLGETIEALFSLSFEILCFRFSNLVAKLVWSRKNMNEKWTEINPLMPEPWRDDLQKWLFS